ncbi:MAG: flagellar biosynthetic protein FliO [Firmicutes bacterium]|nr:flagellar biosynthetic protein FliO [Bacillota bacterium]
MAEIEPLSSWDLVLYASRVLLALVVVVPLLYCGLRLLGRRVTVNRSIKGHIEILDVLHLGGGNQLLLARIAARVLLLAVSKDRVSLLWEGSQEEFDCQERPAEERLAPDLRHWIERWRRGQRGDGQGDDD